MREELFRLNEDIEQRHWWFVARRHIVGRLLQRIAAPGELIIDVGCGTGATLGSLSSRFRCLGIDPSAAAIKIARRNHPDSDFRTGDAPSEISKEASKAAVFLLMDVLEHTPDDFLLLSSLLATARPGAHFLITVPADMTLWSSHDEEHDHSRRYSRIRLEVVWRDLPVEVRLLSHFNSTLYPLIRVARSVARRRRHGWGRMGTDLHMPPSPINRLLTNVLKREGALLERALDRQSITPYNRGVSLIAVLRRGSGDIPLRHRPPDIVPDVYQPQPAR